MPPSCWTSCANIATSSARGDPTRSRRGGSSYSASTGGNSSISGASRADRSCDPLSLGQPVSRRRPCEVLFGEAALAVRGIGERHTFVVDEDVGMMIRRFRLRRKAINEGDRVREGGKCVLLSNGIAFQRPLAEGLRALLGFGP